MNNNQLTGLPPDSVIFGKSASMQNLESRVRRVLGTNLPILLQGEGGSGKSTLSKFIHNNSRNIDGSYFRIDCASGSGPLLGLISPTLVDNHSRPNDNISAAHIDLFGVGTLYLDEVAELSPADQLRLLHLLPDGQDSGFDSQRGTWSRTRLISATARNLRQEVNEKKFRRDLFHRLAVVTLEVPSLRSRLDDLLIIANYLRRNYGDNFGVDDTPFPQRLIERMHYYSWPGNVRELESFVCRYVIFGADARVVYELDPGGGKAVVDAMTPGEPLLKDVAKRTLANVEREMIVQALNLHQGSLKQAARTLGISYRTLMNKMDQAGLPRVRHATRARDELKS